MNEAKRDALKPEEELVDVLLDFIIVSATLAKKVTQAVREKQIKEGVYKDVKNIVWLIIKEIILYWKD